MKSTFSVIYYLKRQVVKKDGTVPVMGRITVDGSHDGVPLQRRTHRNGEFHAGTQEHKDDADIRENHQREAQPRHGEPCRKVERHRGIFMLHHLKTEKP